MRREYIILGAVIVALVFYIAFKNTNRTHYELPKIAQIDKTKITRIVISRGDSTVTLERQNDKWLIEPQAYPADQGEVDKMLDAIAKFELVTLVSESKSYTQYDLDDKARIGVDVFGGSDRLLKFDIGKPASTYHQTFVRLAGNDNVYQAQENIRQPFEIERVRLRDRVVSRFEKVAVTSITFAEAGGKPLAIRKNERPPAVASMGKDSTAAADTGPTWQSDEGRAVRANVVEAVLNTCSNMQCDAFIEGMKKTDLTDPIFTLTIEADKPVTIEIFKKRAGEGNKYPALSSQSDYPFFLSDYLVRQLMKKPSDILERQKG
jgi:hypothetical protein